jgi:TPR repeat protein
MARNTRFNPYDEDRAGLYDEEPNDSEFVGYGSSPSTGEEDEDYPEEPMPLFLSGGDEEARHRGFGSGGERILDRAPIGPRIFKGAIAAASAAAIALAFLTIGNPLALFADAKASLPAATADQAGVTQNLLPPAPAATQLANAGPTPVLPSSAGVRGTAPAPRVTRDDIALALRAAQQNQVQTEPSPPPAVAAAPAMAAPAMPARRLDADELANLLKRARSLIAVGDIAPARLLLERAANAQEASAALLLAQTYDPAVLGTQDMRSITPDPAMARDWYQTAARLGSMDARQRLAQMQN